jgi:cobalamin biosynthesis protein CobT
VRRAGFADSFALWLRIHDEALHRRAMPAEPEARACYDAIERVRYEALGENNYAGMRDNLASAVEHAPRATRSCARPMPSMCRSTPRSRCCCASS